jgi:hypothetical protein
LALKQLVILFTITLFCACSPKAHPVAEKDPVFVVVEKVPAEAPQEIDVPLAQSHWKEATLQTLRTGYSLYTGNCGSCHDLYKPSSYTTSDWELILPKMGRKAELAASDVELIRRYLLTKCKPN